MKNFIDDTQIHKILNDASEIDITAILDKAESFAGLTPEEVAALLMCNDEVAIKRLFEIAGKIKQQIYGDRIVMFGPLYVSDHCVNHCLYCGYKCTNKFNRRKLTQDEIRAEIVVLESMGHKRLALELGEDPLETPIEYVLECLKTIYSTKTKNGEIRRVNVNIAATTEEEYAQLKDAGIGTYILFQETYNKQRYEYLHGDGPKGDYLYHLTAFDRAMAAGVDDVGGGVLFGLYDYKYEVLALMLHNRHLEETFGVGFHTISVPRLCAAQDLDEAMFPDIVTDDEFLKIVAILRVAVPFTGMIISTRESAAMRKQLIDLGISQVSGGSNVNVGGYSSPKEDQGTQFEVSDERDNQDIVRWLLEEGLIPSFCTACYRSGRTGDRFMSLAKSGNIKNVCLPNALLTLQEYACDYGDDDLNAKATAVIEKHLGNIENEKIAAQVKSNLKEIKNGKRDFYL